MHQITLTDSQFEKIKASGILEEKEEFVEIDQKVWSLKMCGIHEWNWKNLDDDYNLLARANVFLTEAEAIKADNKHLALGNIQKFMRENGIEVLKNPDWKDSTEKRQISGYDLWRDSVDISDYYNVNTSPFGLIFSTREDREKVADSCKEDIKVLYS